ncbi:MAG: NAD-dependent epimerase/dehydratase family protein [Brevundimonas sp.]|nr:MAG: NAD-dependent epimerase/dehydratase family protein [Brevundimonas sp.]
MARSGVSEPLFRGHNRDRRRRRLRRQDRQHLIRRRGVNQTLLIIGGQSRSGLAFRKLLATVARGPVKVIVRRSGPVFANETEIVVGDYVDLPTDAFEGVGSAVNFVGAARAPSLAELRALNVEVPLEAARRLKQHGGTGFFQLSSLSVYGGAKDIDSSTPVAPVSSYGRSKADADTGLTDLADDRFRTTIVRAPLIYGPDGGGKLSQLIRLMVRTGRLPVPEILEPRSMVHVDNLAIGLKSLIEAEATGLRFVADPEPFRMDRLVSVIRKEGRDVALVGLPSPVFRLLKLAAPGVYGSLYGRSLIREGDVTPLAGALPLDEGLAQLLPRSSGR